MVYTVIWLKVTSARVAEEMEQMEPLLENIMTLQALQQAVNSIKKEGFDLVEVVFAILSCRFSAYPLPKKTHQPNKKAASAGQFLIFMGTNPGIRCRNLRASFISISIVIMIFIMQKTRNVDTCVIKYNVLHTVEVYNASGSKLNSNINSVPVASYFQTIGFLSIQEELWMRDCSSFPL